MYTVKLIATNEPLVVFDSLQRANAYIIENWNLGPMIVVNSLTEEVVSKPTLLREG